jgi:hypothetical protein
VKPKVIHKLHVWNCSVRGDKPNGGANIRLPVNKLVPVALENMYVVASDALVAARKAVKESGVTRVEYVQAHRVTNLRGLIQ